MIVKKEIRDERNDVLGFYNIVKKINDTQDGIIEVEEQFKETTLVALHDEMTAKLESIQQLNEQIVTAQKDIAQLQQMIDLGEGIENA